MKNSDMDAEISNLEIKDSNLVSDVSNLKSKDSELGSEVSNLMAKDTKLASEISSLVKNMEKLAYSCPSDWVDGGRLGCYYVATKSSKMSYSDAKKFCKSLDNRAHLVEIRSQEIQNFVESLDLSSNGVWWMGATHQEKVKFLIKTCKYISIPFTYFVFDFSPKGWTLDLGK